MEITCYFTVDVKTCKVPCSTNIAKSASMGRRMYLSFSFRINPRLSGYPSSMALNFLDAVERLMFKA